MRRDTSRWARGGVPGGKKNTVASCSPAVVYIHAFLLARGPLSSYYLLRASVGVLASAGFSQAKPISPARYRSHAYTPRGIYVCGVVFYCYCCYHSLTVPLIVSNPRPESCLHVVGVATSHKQFLGSLNPPTAGGGFFTGNTAVQYPCEYAQALFRSSDYDLPRCWQAPGSCH